MEYRRVYLERDEEDEEVQVATKRAGDSPEKGILVSSQRSSGLGQVQMPFIVHSHVQTLNCEW